MFINFCIASKLLPPHNPMTNEMGDFSKHPGLAIVLVR